jgi:hypothetical protein
MVAGSVPVSSSRQRAARSASSLTCSSGAAMCLARSPSRSMMTASGIPVRCATSAAVIRRAGRYPAVARSATPVTGCCPWCRARGR